MDQTMDTCLWRDPVVQAQPDKSVYCGHKYSDHSLPSILHCVSYCLYQIYHNSRPHLFTVHCSRAWRVVQTFRELFFKYKPNYKALNSYSETAQNLLKIIQCSCGIRVPEMPESQRSWHFICITQGKHVLHQWWETGTTTAGLIPQLSKD